MRSVLLCLALLGACSRAPTNEVAARFDQYTLKTELRAPFRGTWTALNAARNASNPHFTNPNQRFAVDWVKTQGGKTFRTDGKTNADYFAYGEDALAPAAGTVAIVVDGVAKDRYEPTERAQMAANVPGDR